MKNYLLPFFFIFVIFASFSWNSDNSKSSFELLKEGFVTPPDSIQTAVYWYWISDNISREGVIEDLKSMKRAGINRAFIGNIGLSDIPYGKVKMLTPEWWDILHAALKCATELNIEIGIFNSPGWSQSGGPWVKAEQAMRYLASSQVHVRGPQKFSQVLPKPNELFQDVKVIAFPTPKNNEVVLNNLNAKIKIDPSTVDPGLLFDGSIKTGLFLAPKKTHTIDFEATSPFTARSLAIFPTNTPTYFDAEIDAMGADGQFVKLSEFSFNRSNTALNVGFEPYAPVVVSFAEVTSSKFRIVIKNCASKSGVGEIKLSAAPFVERYSEKTLAKMHPTPLPYWKDYQWPAQPEPNDKSMVIDTRKMVDISSNRNPDGTLNWNVPEGEWTIMRTGMTPTGTVNSPASPEATGLEVDKMSKQHVEHHFYGHIGEVLKRIPEADRKTFKVVVQDSYETGGQNFTDNFLDEFKQRFGYDAIFYLPVYQGFVVNSELESDRFLWDMRRMVADKVAYDYVGGLRDISHKYGLKTWLECYGHWGFPSEFLMYGGQSDEISGEFWSEGDLGNIENRAASSCGHIYGKQKIWAESNTCSGKPFSRYPGVIKQRSDRFFSEGINSTLLHVFISQPFKDKYPGINAWFGNEFNRNNTWFSQMDVYTQYLKRTNFMLQQGINVADVAYFIGEDAPKMTGIADPALPVGYQFDYINAEVIEKTMTVKDGLLTLPHGTQYRILVLPQLKTMRPGLLRKIKQLVRDGGVILGPTPQLSPSLQNQPIADQEVKILASEIWGNADGVKMKFRKYGKGIVINGMNMKEAFDLIRCIPDCNLPSDNSILYNHRTTSMGEIYYITNQTANRTTVTPAFRVMGMSPELWEATSGHIRKLNAFIQRDQVTEVPIKLAPYESAFIVFRKNETAAKTPRVENNYPDPTLLRDLRGPWSVKFDPNSRGPEKPVVFETLKDWSTFQDEAIKYYSGSATYAIKFEAGAITQQKQVYISLGKLTAMAKVTINGNYAGGVWTEPYQLDITKFIKAGENEIKIEVVNTWVNRLIGDSKLPEGQRPTWCPVNPFKPTDPLQPSGLFGPVQLLSYNY